VPESLPGRPARERAPSKSAPAQVVANGTSHSGEGLKLEEVALRAGDAQLLVRGALLGAAQARARASRRSSHGPRCGHAPRCAERCGLPAQLLDTSVCG